MGPVVSGGDEPRVRGGGGNKYEEEEGAKIRGGEGENRANDGRAVAGRQ